MSLIALSLLKCFTEVVGYDHHLKYTKKSDVSHVVYLFKDQVQTGLLTLASVIVIIKVM
jgi:hypothetical protein